MSNFTPVSATIGGMLIGLSSGLLLWFNGRIAGISGILHGAFMLRKNDFLWRMLFLIGLILGGLVYYIIPSVHFVPRTNYPVYLTLIAGFLVGIGTKIGGGCTSGHGVCGMARMSLRSFVATIIFFICALFTTYFVKHIWNIS